MKKYLTIVGDVEDCEVFFVLAFKSREERFRAREIMLEHRRDDEELYDTENMLNALDNSKIEYDKYEGFEELSEIWI